MTIKRVLPLLSVVLLVSMAVPAEADTILYDDGPINGNFIALGISGVVGEISDSFTLSSRADVESMSLGIWASRGEIPSTLQFGISATALGSDLGGGTGILSNVFQFNNSFGDDVYLSSFTFPNSVNLVAGTYYVTLLNGSTTNGDPLFWDMNDGPSIAFAPGLHEKPPGSIEQYPSESFSLDGTASTTPEPPTLIMLGTGILGIAGTIRWKLTT